MTQMKKLQFIIPNQIQISIEKFLYTLIIVIVMVVSHVFAWRWDINSWKGKMVHIFSPISKCIFCHHKDFFNIQSS
jgi:hypothetical protein